jgi:hypothetical protein
MRIIVVVCCLLICLVSCRKERLNLVVKEYQSLSNFNWHSIALKGQDTVIVGGGDTYAEGSLLMSYNKGNDWQLLRSIHTAGFYALALYPDGAVYAGAYDGASLVYFPWNKNSGTYYLPYEGSVKAVNIRSENEVLVVKGDYRGGMIHLTRDATFNWFSHELKFEPNFALALPENKYLVGGYGAMVLSDDGGNTWQHSEVKGDNFTAAHFISTQTGFVVGSDGGIFKTIDGGKKWVRTRNSNMPFSARSHFLSIHFYDQTNGCIAGASGKLLFTKDGGDTWSEARRFTHVNLRSVKLFDSRRGIAAGDEGRVFLFEISQ